jgi:hypothetical protein
MSRQTPTETAEKEKLTTFKDKIERVSLLLKELKTLSKTCKEITSFEAVEDKERQVSLFAIIYYSKRKCRSVRTKM